MKMDYVRQVSREDVLRVIRREFPSDAPDEILGLLETYGTQSWHSGKDRVQLALLKLSASNVEKLRRHVETALIDFRDVVCPAEYPQFWQAGLVLASRMNREDQEPLQQDDWRQYKDWLDHK